LLAPGEGGLKDQSVVNVSQTVVVNKQDLQDKIGSLDYERVNEIINGICLLLKGER